MCSSTITCHNTWRDENTGEILFSKIISLCTNRRDLEIICGCFDLECELYLSLIDSTNSQASSYLGLQLLVVELFEESKVQAMDDRSIHCTHVSLFRMKW